jgi:hypothetical protein
MNRSQDRMLATVAVVLGVALLVVAVVYWAESAGSLPGFFPGHKAGSGEHHVKHGIAAAIVALALFAFAWFRTGPSRAGSST